MFKKIFLIMSLCIVFTAGTVSAGGQNIEDCRDRLTCDLSGLLSAEQIDRMTEYHSALLERYDIDLRVIVAKGLGDLGPKTVQLFQDFNVGEKSQTRKGVLLVIDPALDNVRMEISAGLDAVYTDGFVKYLQGKQMVPFFWAGRVADGVLATTELIVDRAQKAARKEEFVPPDALPKKLAIGAGAQGKAGIGKGYSTSSSGTDVSARGLSPEAVVAAYHRALSEGNASPDLSIYSNATKQMRKSWVVTPAQMKMEYNTFQNCRMDRVVYTSDGQMAIVRYNVSQRQCSPYFLVNEGGEWKLDFAAMMRMVRFNVSNEWHFNLSGTSPEVLKALSDWRFNKNGYPYP